MIFEGVDLDRLPDDVRERLNELQLELSEGDITQKGYEKKIRQLLAPFVAKNGGVANKNMASVIESPASPNTRAHRRNQRRLTREEPRFHSEIRQEAVLQALAEYSSGKKEKPSLVQPRRRNNSSVTRNPKYSDSSSGDEDSLFGSVARNQKQRRSGTNGKSEAGPSSSTSGVLTANGSSSLSASSGPAVEAMLQRVHEQHEKNMQSRRDMESVKLREKEKVTPKAATDSPQSPASADGVAKKRTSRIDYRNSRIIVTEDEEIRISPAAIEEITVLDDAVYVNTQFPQEMRQDTGQDYQNAILPLKPAKVSAKIQNVVNALQRPKSRPLQEFYNDDDVELETLAKQRDPTAPRPEGAMMTPVRGENPREANGNASSAQTQPRSLDSALHRFGTTAAKCVAGVVLDATGKPGAQITYGKLLRRANKIAFTLLNKTITVGKENTKMPICKPGDRVALVYPNAEPLQFLAAFHACLIAGVIPVPVEVPLTKRDAGIAQLGFLLGNNGVKVALTSETCYKGLPKKSWTWAGAASPSGSSSLNGQSTEMVDFKGWPRLYWLITEHLPKPSRDWAPSARAADDTIAYIEYSTDRDGAVKGVCVSRQSVVAHCKSLVNALEYKQNETMVCVVDFKREFGLWHSVLAATYVGMRVVFVPYSLTKMNPASWMVMATKMHASVAVVKSRDLHWGVLASKDTSEINLSSLRSLIVADGANPWSLSSCDHFVRTFAVHGLRPDAMCPCAGSSETGTISIRRPTALGNGSSGRGVLSMTALSHSVVRVDQEDSLNSLTLQDAGQVVSGGVVVVVQLEGLARLCKADEVGEICLCAHSTGQSYWALDGQTQFTFKVEPLNENDKPLGVLSYVRSGLIGFMAPDGLVFVVGKKSSLLKVSGRQHSADDIIATVLAVEPMRFVYRGRICVFSVNVLRDERIVIVAEQKAGCSEEDSFNWMNRVLQAIEAIHSVGIYCIALVPPNQLPKAPLGGIHVSETKQRFEAGELHPSTIQMCPHSCILNLPKPRERQSDVGPAAIFVGNIVQGVRIAGAQGAPLDDEMSLPLADVLRSRAQTNADHRIFTLVTAKNVEADTATFGSLLKRAEKVAALLTDKSRLNVGDHVVLVFPPSIDLIAAFFGCLLAGMVPVCVRPPTAATLQSTLPNLRSTVDISKAVAILSSSPITKLLKSKEAVHCVDSKVWPMIIDIEDAPSSWKRKVNSLSELREVARGDVCYMDFSMNACGQLSGVVITMEAAISLCKGLKLSCELYPSRHVLVCVDPYSGLGLALWCLSSVFSGHHTTLIPPGEIDASPQLFLSTLSAGKIRDAFCTYAVVENNVRELATQVSAMKERGINLSTIRTCVIVAEERPRITLIHAFCRLFAPLSLAARAVSTSFGCSANPAICMQGASAPEPSTVYVDARALRNDRVTLVGKGAPHSIALLESGKIMPGVKIAIANPETRGQCADSHLGEIWICSPQNASGSFIVYGEENGLQTDHFNARLTTGDVKTRWARTGYLGFLRQTQSITEHGELHDAVFVVGALDESLQLRGMRFHPSDLEATVGKAHKHIGETAVFTWNNLLVVVAECQGPEAEALDLIPAVTSAMVETQQLIVGVVVIVDPRTIPLNSRGEKQRNLLREQFTHNQLDPIYLAYNT